MQMADHTRTQHTQHNRQTSTTKTKIARADGEEGGTRHRGEGHTTLEITASKADTQHPRQSREEHSRTKMWPRGRSIGSPRMFGLQARASPSTF